MKSGDMESDGRNRGKIKRFIKKKRGYKNLEIFCASLRADHLWKSMRKVSSLLND